MRLLSWRRKITSDLNASPAKVVASLRVSQVTSRDEVDVKVFTTVEESVKLKIGKLDTNKNVRHQARTSNVQVCC